MPINDKPTSPMCCRTPTREEQITFAREFPDYTRCRHGVTPMGCRFCQRAATTAARAE